MVPSKSPLLSETENANFQCKFPPKWLDKNFKKLIDNQ